MRARSEPIRPWGFAANGRGLKCKATVHNNGAASLEHWACERRPHLSEKKTADKLLILW